MMTRSSPILEASVRSWVFPFVFDGIVYDILNVGDLEAATTCLAKTFAVGEPMTSVLGIREFDFLPFAEVFCRRAVVEGVSVAARDAQTGRLLGCQISEDFASGPPKGLEHVSPKFDPILALLAQLDQGSATTCAVENNQLLHEFMLGVDLEHRGRHLGYHLVGASHRLGQMRGFQGAVSEVTGPSSRHILVNKHHYQVLNSIDYRDFVFHEQKVFETMTAVRSCQLVYKAFHLTPGKENARRAVANAA